jgi:pimeloyl-ACP methyl ester carboxylesterase
MVLARPLVRLLVALMLVLLPGTASFAQAAPPPAASGVRVVYIGGLGSTAASTAAVFGPLSSALRTQAGYTADDFSTFDYDDPDGHACAPLASSAERLAAYVRNLRDTHQADAVVLVGHSMGGVVALDAAAHFSELTEPDHPFVQRVITLDSPLGGLTRMQRSVVAGLWLGPCPAANDAYLRYVDSAWPATLAAHVDNLLQRGVQVFAVANPEDLLLDTWTQHVPNSKVNFTVSAIDDMLSHAALLSAPSALGELVSMIGPRPA